MAFVTQFEEKIGLESKKFLLPDVCSVGVKCPNGNTAQVWICLASKADIETHNESENSWFHYKDVAAGDDWVIHFDPAPAAIQIRAGTGTDKTLYVR